MYILQNASLAIFSAGVPADVHMYLYSLLYDELERKRESAKKINILVKLDFTLRYMAMRRSNADLSGYISVYRLFLWNELHLF